MQLSDALSILCLEPDYSRKELVSSFNFISNEFHPDTGSKKNLPLYECGLYAYELLSQQLEKEPLPLSKLTENIQNKGPDEIREIVLEIFEHFDGVRFQKHLSEIFDTELQHTIEIVNTDAFTTMKAQFLSADRKTMVQLEYKTYLYGQFRNNTSIDSLITLNSKILHDFKDIKVTKNNRIESLSDLELFDVTMIFPPLKLLKLIKSNSNRIHQKRDWISAIESLTKFKRVKQSGSDFVAILKIVINGNPHKIQLNRFTNFNQGMWQLTNFKSGYNITSTSILEAHSSLESFIETLNSIGTEPIESINESIHEIAIHGQKVGKQL